MKKLEVEYQTRETMFHHVTRYREEGWKYLAQWRFFSLNSKRLKGCVHCFISAGNWSLRWLKTVSNTFQDLDFWCVIIGTLYQWGSEPPKSFLVLNPMHRIVLNFAKSYILSCLSKFYNKKTFHRAVLKYKRLKLKLMVFLAVIGFPW